MTSMMFPRLFFGLVVLSCLAIAQQSAPSQQAQPITPPAAATDAGRVLADKPAADGSSVPRPTSATSIRIGAGDLLDISVFGVPDLTQKTRVTSSGDIYLPLVGYVHLDGMTVEEAQSAIERKLIEGQFLKEPHVTIFIAEYATGVTVMGEVAHPGVYPIFGSRRLFDVISAAGGLTDRAGRVVTVTHRDRPQEPQSVVFDPQSASSNVEIAQGDTIVVTRGGVVYVVGEVQQPSGFIMEGSQSFTVLKALALSHGPARYAKLDSSKIIRKNPDGSYKEIPVALRKILDAKEKDIPLQADDIVFVPASGGKRAAEQTVNSIVGIAGAMVLRLP